MSSAAIPSGGARERGALGQGTVELKAAHRGMQASASVAASCRGVLGQCREFLGGIEQDAFVRSSGVMFGATIGQHVRHALDHFAAALRSDASPIEYDHRERDTAIERSLEAARSEIECLLDDLSRSRVTGDVVVRVMVSGDGTLADLPSTLERELAFAAHHAIHHHAMIGAIAKEFGVAVPKGFGKAPSTIEHEARRSGPCGQGCGCAGARQGAGGTAGAAKA